MGMSAVSSRVINPVDRHHLKRLRKYLESGVRNQKQNKYFNPENIILHHFPEAAFHFKVVSDRIFIHHADLHLLQDHFLVKSDWVRELFPHRFRKVLHVAHKYADNRRYRDDHKYLLLHFNIEAVSLIGLRVGVEGIISSKLRYKSFLPVKYRQ